jgi:hypothetical protein
MPYIIHRTDVQMKFTIIQIDMSSTDLVLNIFITCGISDIVEVKAAKKPIIWTIINIPPPALSGSGQRDCKSASQP